MFNFRYLRQLGHRGAAGIRLPLLFGPGLFFVALGIVVIFAPKLVLAMLSGFLLFIGVALCYITWRAIQFRKQFEGTLKDFQGRFQIQAFHISPPFEREVVDLEEEEDSLGPRKIVIH